MKIYVSDNIYEYLAIGKRDIHSGVDDDLVVKSLEQHEAEIRKSLEDEIVKLNELISRLISEKEPETAKEITERYHREILLERQNKFLEEKVERLKKELNPNVGEFANRLKQQERQKVIAELEEFVKKLFSVEDFIEKLYVNSVSHKNGVPRDNTPYTRNKIKNIKKRLIEKLKEMKGV